jgi:hypothetical protein
MPLVETQAPPIAWPEVTIGGFTLPIKHSFQVLYRASAAGVNIGTSFASSMDLFAFIVADEMKALGHEPLSGEEWAGLIQSTEHLKEISRAIALSFELSQKKSAAGTPPTPQE